MKIRATSSIPAPAAPVAAAERVASKRTGAPREPVDVVRLSEVNAPAVARMKSDAARVLAHLATSSAVAATAGPAVGFATHQAMKTGFVQGYLEPADILARARDLQRRYPDLVELVERPYQTPGYDGKREDLRGPAPLYYLRIGPRKDAERDAKVGVMQLAAPHAREWVPPMVIMELAEQLVANYDPSSQDPQVQANTRLVDSLDIYLLPMTNPDGANYSFHDDPMWRRTRSPQASEPGVDGNRNYGYRWVASQPGTETYGGPRAFSEPETRHVAGMVQDHPNIRFVVDWHSYAQEVRRPLGLEGPVLEFYQRFQDRMAEAIGSVRGTPYKVVESPIVEGASDDYFHNVKGVYASLVEVGTEFQPPQDEAVKVMGESVAGAREILEVAREFAEGAEPA